ncbi:MAG TPA: DNA-processing protein DprA [Gemmatimonadaceae bacterium]|nr:DNA-processing protein DprA [Gemmatimonadaceae bacterium]
MLHPEAPAYPTRLHECSDPPRTLWARGDLSLCDRPCVAIVGTRRATAYGERVARELGRVLALAGATIVSGLARGIDAAAHRGALDVDGATCAVLGTGLDVVYPKAHAQLQRTIADRGLLLSELEPQNAAHGGSFPRRNRIIAALSCVTVVVEAGVKSGALITAAHALELGRTVAVVPGPIDVPQAQGSNELLRDGAAVIATIADAIALAGLTAPIRLAELPEGGAERRLWDALADGSADLDTLCTRAALPAHEGLAAVAGLEMRGLIECAMTGEIRRA